MFSMQGAKAESVSSGFRKRGLVNGVTPFVLLKMMKQKKTKESKESKERKKRKKTRKGHISGKRTLWTNTGQN